MPIRKSEIAGWSCQQSAVSGQPDQTSQSSDRLIVGAGFIPARQRLTNKQVSSIQHLVSRKSGLYACHKYSPTRCFPRTPAVCPRQAPSGKVGVEVGAKKKSLSCLQLKDCTQFTLSLRIVDPSHVRVACTRLAPGQVFWLSDHPSCRAFPSSFDWKVVTCGFRPR